MLFTAYSTSRGEGSARHQGRLILLKISLQCGEGRDVGLIGIEASEGKVASGNGEQTLSRDIYRLGQLLEFFWMLSFFFTTVGYSLTTTIFVIEDDYIYLREGADAKVYSTTAVAEAGAAAAAATAVQ